MEETPLRRFLRVILIILYSLSAIFSVILGFSLESFWSFLISLLVCWLILDVVNVSVNYISSGKNSISKSWLLRGYLILFDNDTYNNLIAGESEEKVSNAYDKVIDKMMPELTKIISRDRLGKILKFANAVDEQKESASVKLEELYKRVGKDEKFFDTKESWELDLETLKSQHQLKTDLGQANLFYDLTAPLTGEFVSINHKLSKGSISLEKAFEELHKNSDKRHKQFVKRIVPFSFWVIGGNEIIRIKESGQDMDKAKVEGDNINKEAKKYLGEQLSYAEGLLI